MDWTREDGKIDMIKTVWGKEVPNYLFYSIGKCTVALCNEGIVAACFNGSNPGFGDIEVHKSSKQDVGYYIRIRYAKVLKLHLNITDVNGNKIAAILYQAGHASDERCVDFIKGRQSTPLEAKSAVANWASNVLQKNS